MKKFTIYLAGDSTVQSYKTPVKPITGWGQMLHTYFKETEQKMNQDGCDWMGYGKKSDSDFDQSIIYETDGLFVDNRAMAGRSSRSYFDEGRLDDLKRRSSQVTICSCSLRITMQTRKRGALCYAQAV